MEGTVHAVMVKQRVDVSGRQGRMEDNSRAHWDRVPHDGGVVISVHGSTSLCWGSQTLGNKMGAMGPVWWYRPRWTQWARNLRNHFESSVYFNIGGSIFLLLKGQNLKKKIPSKCFTICMVCKYFLKSTASSWFNSHAQRVRQEMRLTYLLLLAVHAVSGSQLWRYSFSYTFEDFCNFGSCDYICDRFKLIFHYGVRSGSGFIFLHKMFNYPGIIC